MSKKGGGLNLERADSNSDFCAILTASYSPCSRRGAIMVRWSGNRPMIRACVQHAEGYIFQGLVPFARIKLARN